MNDQTQAPRTNPVEIRSKRLAQIESAATGYRRYHLESEPAPDRVLLPSRFRVRVTKHRLALMLFKELLHYRGNREVALSPPCVYGVFSGPLGGFAPRERLCVGCLRCTTEYPDIVQISHNPVRQRLGDSYFKPEYVDAVSYEARTGKIPVKGAGYRGQFGGSGWDGMWLDMSEIVRPTRDGIHGREFISTVTDIGEKPWFLQLDAAGKPVGPVPRIVSISIPVLFDAPPASALDHALAEILSRAAEETDTLAVVPAAMLGKSQLCMKHLVPLIMPGEPPAWREWEFTPPMIELGAWEGRLYQEVRSRFPACIVAVRLPFGRAFEEKLLTLFEVGVRVFHLVANYQGRGEDGAFVLDLIRKAHRAFLEVRHRDEVTLLGSGGIVAAEHVPKAIIAGLDGVAIDTSILVALQTRMRGESVTRETSRFELPPLDIAWGVQRLRNLMASWHDQLLEVAGAMGMREVRRMRGEIGRAMFQKELEREAFAGISGYGD